MDENRLPPFVFEGDILIRVTMRDSQPWFVAADICRALGLLNPTDAVKGLDDDEKGLAHLIHRVSQYAVQALYYDTITI